MKRILTFIMLATLIQWQLYRCTRSDERLFRSFIMETMPDSIHDLTTDFKSGREYVFRASFNMAREDFVTLKISRRFKVVEEDNIQKFVPLYLSTRMPSWPESEALKDLIVYKDTSIIGVICYFITDSSHSRYYFFSGNY